MSLTKHRLAAASILAAGVVILIAWGRSQAHETAQIRDVRRNFEGRWVATLIQAGEQRKATGPEAEACRIAFSGKSVDFAGMIGGVDGRGTYLVQPEGKGGKLDLKLDAGWSIGVFEADADRLAFAINPLALPERLGVPTRARPGRVRAGEGHHYYVFRRALAGE